MVKNLNQQNLRGFTLLELVVVLAGLSILSSLAIPNIAKIFDFNNIDEAKALLNTAAADCLQKERLESNIDRGNIDSNILSSNRLKSIGYKIDPEANKCSYLKITPINSKDKFRFPIGFAITNGRVTKIATPTTSDIGSINSCQSWAGANCQQSEEMKSLVAYNKRIREAKTKCEKQYSEWMESNGNGAISRWNPAADSACASTPPKVVNSTCTTNGCNRKVYALEGRIVGYTQDDYNKALEAKYGRICTEKVEGLRRQSPPFTNSEERPITFKECGKQEFWFHEGTEVASANKWRELMCTDEINKNINETKKTKLSFCGDKTYYFCEGKDQLSIDKWDTCVANNAEAKCLADKENARQRNHKGKYPGVAGPGKCGETVWMCNRKIITSEADYQNSACSGIQPTITCPAKQSLLCQYYGSGPWCECD